MLEFNLIKDMKLTPEVIKNFDNNNNQEVKDIILKNNKIILTGEGSSRIFPAKNAIDYVKRNNLNYIVETYNSRQVAEYNPLGYTIFGASNSGETKELIECFQTIDNPNKYGITITPNSNLHKVTKKTYNLKSPKEVAIAATVSVIEQTLFFQSFFNGDEWQHKDELAQYIADILDSDINDNIISKIANSNKIYFAGRNNGVAEELTLKTNEITRLPSQYLEGTILLHGIEEVMEKDETIILIEPDKKDFKNIKEKLSDPIGINIVAISSKDTPFETIKVPKLDNFDNFIQLAAGWNLLVKTGLKLDIDLDTAKRARKIGNKF